MVLCPQAIHHLSAAQGHSPSLPVWEASSQLEQVSLSCNLMARKAARYLQRPKEHAPAAHLVDPTERHNPCRQLVLASTCSLRHLVCIHHQTFIHKVS